MIVKREREKKYEKKTLDLRGEGEIYLEIEIEQM